VESETAQSDELKRPSGARLAIFTMSFHESASNFVFSAFQVGQCL
jgi:hypothetical protein